VAAIRRIEQASKDSHCAVLDGDVRIPVSRTGYQKVRGLVR
jgi:two-component system LytT family response regulator